MNPDHSLADWRDLALRLEHEVAQAVIGQAPTLRLINVALFARGHVLLEGVPGLAKTLAVRTLAGTLNAKFQRIQFTPDLMPSDILGTEILYEIKTGDGVLRAVVPTSQLYEVGSPVRIEPADSLTNNSRSNGSSRNSSSLDRCDTYSTARFCPGKGRE